MAKFRYTGNIDRPQIIRGLSFTQHEWTEVPDDLSERFNGHSHLERLAADGDETSDEGDDTAEPKRRGRPPKVRED